VFLLGAGLTRSGTVRLVIRPHQGLCALEAKEGGQEKAGVHTFLRVTVKVLPSPGLLCTFTVPP
jgi:hypothetical protein